MRDYAELRAVAADAVARLDALPVTAPPYGVRPRHDRDAVAKLRAELRAELRPLASSFWPAISPCLAALRDARRDAERHGRIARLRSVLARIARGDRPGAFTGDDDE